MANDHSFYYGNYSGQQQMMSSTYSNFGEPFINHYNSNGSTNTMPNYSQNNYPVAFPNTPPSIPTYNGQSLFSSQPTSLSVNGKALLPTEENRNNTHKNNLLSNPKPTNHFDERCFQEDLDEPLNELPLESLLHLTHQEGQLISESEAEDMRVSGSSDVCMPLSQNDNVATSFYSSNPSFFLDKDIDEDDSGSCLSSSTFYSLTSTPDSVVHTQPLNQNYEQLSNSSPTSNHVNHCSNIPYEPGSFREALSSSHSYQPQSDLSPPNSRPSFSNLNCNGTNGKYLHPNNNNISPRGPRTEYQPVSPSYENDMTDMDYFENSKGHQQEQTVKQDLKNNQRYVAKKIKLKKDSKSEQDGPKNSKKHKVKDIFDMNKKNPHSTRDNNQRVLNDLNKRINISVSQDEDSSENSMMDSPSKNGFSSSNNSLQDHQQKTTPPRKRMRCPRGMSLEIKPCEVCGDNAKNMHFGGLVCDSCKAFFRRSVQSSTWDQFQCEKDGNCTITKENRRSCQYCRFQKCEKIGMQMEWVMTESGRMNLLKNRLARTRQIHVEKEKDVVYGELPRSLSRDDAEAINCILNDLHMAFGSMPYPRECVGNSIDTLSNIFVFLCKRFGKFFLKITETSKLCKEDKTLLLKNGIAMSLYINGAHMYDSENHSWPSKTTHESVKVPHLTLETLQKLAAIPDAFSTIMKFYDEYEGDLKDHVVAVLMYLTSFFLTEDPEFEDPREVQNLQQEYTGYLKRYLIARDGYKSTSGIFVKLMDGLTYVKEILKFHTMVDIKPTIDHNETSAYSSNNSSITQSMSNLIHQIEMSLKGSFPPYASVLNDSEKVSLGGNSNGDWSSPSRALMRRNGSFGRDVMPNHPGTIAIFGQTTRTDMLITQTFQNMIEWQDRCDLPMLSPVPSEESSDSIFGEPFRCLGDNEKIPKGNKDFTGLLSVKDRISIKGQNDGNDDDDMVLGQEVDVDAVCDILNKLSHTDDVKVFSILKENIPIELLEKFSRSLSEDDT